MSEQVSCSVLCQFLDESDCEARWVTHRQYEKAGESLAPDTNVPSSSTGTAASLWGHRKEMDSSLSTRKRILGGYAELPHVKTGASNLRNPRSFLEKPIPEHFFTKISEAAYTNDR